MGADEPANGEGVIEGTPQYAQDQPYGAAVAPDGRADCEAGQRGFVVAAREEHLDELLGQPLAELVGHGRVDFVPSCRQVVDDVLQLSPGRAHAPCAQDPPYRPARRPA